MSTRLAVQLDALDREAQALSRILKHDADLSPQIRSKLRRTISHLKSLEDELYSSHRNPRPACVHGWLSAVLMAHPHSKKEIIVKAVYEGFDGSGATIIFDQMVNDGQVVHMGNGQYLDKDIAEMSIPTRKNGYKAVVKGPIALETPTGTYIIQQNPCKVALVEPEEVALIGFPEHKIRKIEPLLVPAFHAIRRMANKPHLQFPSPILPMEEGEIAYGRTIRDSGHEGGAGHGQFNSATCQAKVNASMPPQKILLNVVHENLHYAFPDESEVQIDHRTNEVLQSL